jgi:hypothetical protein
MLAGSFNEVLPEWLAAVAAAGLRVPEVHLPALLRRGGVDAKLREAIRPVLGRRGEWLARQNPEWSWAIGESGDADWQTATRAERLATLRGTRRENPAAARDLIASTWEHDPPDDRAAFLDELKPGLSLADEPLLERALDDSRKEVRQAALSLLSSLPDSRLVARMKARLQPLLTFKPGRKPKLNVELPDWKLLTPDLRRDGIAEKPPPGEKLGQKAWWVQQMITMVPPTHWQTVWSAKVEDVLAADAGDWTTLLLQGWSGAAERFRDAAWAEAIMRHLADAKKSEDYFGFRGVAEALPGVLPHARRETLMLERLAAKKAFHSDPFLLELLRAEPLDPTPLRPMWSRDAARRIVAGIREASTQSLRSRDGAATHLVGELPRLALQCPPALADEFRQGWPTDNKDWNYWDKPVQQFLDTLTFRQQMLQEIAP